MSEKQESSKRKIVVMVGSASDLPQCERGLQQLKDYEDSGAIKVIEVIVNSIHRNMDVVMFNLRGLLPRADVIIAGAGWANHLTGMVDAALRYKMEDDHIVVVGVAFEDRNNYTHTQAACLSITEVPGTQAVFNGYVGSEGFLAACKFAAFGDLPKIALPAKKPALSMTLEQAMNYGKQPAAAKI